MKQAENEIKYALARQFLEKLLNRGLINQDEFRVAERHIAGRFNAKIAVCFM
jgi:hypothetical protein